MADTSEVEPGIVLSELATTRINSALAEARPVAVSYVDSEGRPHLSLRGSVQVYSPDQLSIWVRHAEGGIVEQIAKNAHVALLYRNSDTKSTYTFMGRARVDEDEAVRKTVYDNSPEPERNHDPEMHGAAVIIDLDVAKGFTIGGDRFDMIRA
jgi:general stress protein 26